jgi:hypothetical protein
MEDAEGFSAPILAWNWKFLEVKNLLMIAPTPIDKDYEYVKGRKICNVALERITVWVIEAAPRDPNYCYLKKILWVDPETFFFTQVNVYDRTGRIWKDFFYVHAIVPNPYGGFAQVINAGGGSDWRIGEGGPWDSAPDVNVADLKPERFTLDYMRRMGR